MLSPTRISPGLARPDRAGGEVDGVSCDAVGAFFEVDLTGDDKTGGNARVEGEASAHLLLVVRVQHIDSFRGSPVPP